MKTEYLFVAVIGLNEIKKWFGGATRKEARKAFWASLSDHEQNATEIIECIDERNV